MLMTHVLFVETADEIQSVLDAITYYCRLCRLQVNPAKTKASVFWKI